MHFNPHNKNSESNLLRVLVTAVISNSSSFLVSLFLRLGPPPPKKNNMKKGREKRVNLEKLMGELAKMQPL